MNHTDSWAEKR